ncbi:MAG: nucleotide exchange factor GrpE [Candidatus Tectomicrobia bacterium]|uniref:Protein GrpE n=1 Tax=Tectimicrobiota bacterium TaxID=2528274 RepID=A0A932HVB7_UNCTE|nr:nucleotide exchange factor GrpE [Candidatus Tectomicrobia bacterium]
MERVNIQWGEETPPPGPAGPEPNEAKAAGKEKKEEEEEKAKGAAKVVDRRRKYGEDVGAAPDEPVKAVPTYVQQLEQKLARAEEKLKEHIERINREAAEFRARQERELERRTLESRKRAVAAFLPLAEDLGRAVAAASGASGEEALGKLLEGLRLVQGRFLQELAAQGVAPFESLGQPFDPSLHEAVLTREVTDPAQDGRVVEELGQGYRLGDEVIRPSRAVVGKLRREERPSGS